MENKFVWKVVQFSKPRTRWINLGVRGREENEVEEKMQNKDDLEAKVAGVEHRGESPIQIQIQIKQIAK